MSRLENKVALITGATSGIGLATAELFAAEGARLALTGRRQERGQALAERLGCLYLPADHRLETECARAVEQTLQTYGRIDILFNNAGIVLEGTAETTSEADWTEIMNINVTAVWRMSRLVLPTMRRQGSGAIVNNASDWGLVGAQNALPYCVSKGAVIQMTRCMALDHAREGIRVNAVCPGDTFVERWTQEGYFRGSGGVDEIVAHMSDDLPIGRVAETSEIAKAVLFLASDEASFITGTTLLVDGGNTAR